MGPLIYDAWADGTLVENLEITRAIVTGYDIGMVVVDGAERAVGNPKESDAIRAYLEALTRLKIPSLSLIRFQNILPGMAAFNGEWRKGAEQLLWINPMNLRTVRLHSLENGGQTPPPSRDIGMITLPDRDVFQEE